jgi:hypothetical protein
VGLRDAQWSTRVIGPAQGLHCMGVQGARRGCCALLPDHHGVLDSPAGTAGPRRAGLARGQLPQVLISVIRP